MRYLLSENDAAIPVGGKLVRPGDLLPRDPCLEALAESRRANWYQVSIPRYHGQRIEGLKRFHFFSYFSELKSLTFFSENMLYFICFQPSILCIMIRLRFFSVLILGSVFLK